MARSDDKPQFEGEWVRLGDVVSESRERNRNAFCTDIYSVTNSRGFTPSTDYFSKEVYSKDLSKYRIVRRGMIAYNPSRINVGSVAIQDVMAEVSVSPLYVVFSVDQTRMLPEYVLRYLKSKPGLHQIGNQSIGTIRKSLKYNSLCNLKIKLISLDKQSICVHILEIILSQIKLHEQYITTLDTLIKSRFIEMFGDSNLPFKAIGDLAIDVRYGTSKKAFDDGRYIYLRMNNITDEGTLDFSEIKRITLDGEELEKCSVLNGDVLFNRTNSREKVGKSAVFTKDEPMVIAGYIIRIRPGREIKGEFLASFLNLESTKKKIRSMAKGAVHQANINAKELASVKVPVPPLALQDEFLSFVQKVDKLKFAV